jgi:hypothetical protein
LILFGTALFSLLSTCPNRLNLCDLLNLTVSSLFSNAFISSLYLILHKLFSITGPYILRIISLEPSQYILFYCC